MKIGLSYSRCVRDIIDEKVDINDVLVIISRTDFDPHSDVHWKDIWAGYSTVNGWNHPEWSGYSEADEPKFRAITINLYDSGKLHQPRKFGGNPTRLPHIWLEAVLPTEDLDKNPTLKAAWQRFQTLASLSSVELHKDYQ